MPTLEYVSWQKFKNVPIKAQLACENSGYDLGDHFNRLDEMVAIGSDAKHEVEDMHLSRYACYPVVQNTYPPKEVVALGQTYFAVFKDHGYRRLYNGLTALSRQAPMGLQSITTIDSWYCYS